MMIKHPEDGSSQASSESAMIDSLTIDEENSTSPDEESTITDSLANDDSEDDEDIIKDDSVWHTIKFWAEDHHCSLLDSFKFLLRLSRSLDHDATIETIMDSVHSIRDGSDYAKSGSKQRWTVLWRSEHF